MSAAAWTEGADVELAGALEEYQWLRRALRKLRFPRHPAEVLAAADQRLSDGKTRLARVGKRLELPELSQVLKLEERCEAERDAVLDATLAAAGRLAIPFRADTRGVLSEIYRSPHRWPARSTKSRGFLAWQIFSSAVGALELCAGLLLLLLVSVAWPVALFMICTGASMIASTFARWGLVAGVLGVIGSVICFGLPLWVISSGGMC